MITSPAKRQAKIATEVQTRYVDRDVAARRLRRMRLLGVVERCPRAPNGSRYYVMRGNVMTWGVVA